jgi:glutaredoxin
VSALVTNEVEPQETLPENTESKEALIEDDENSDAADTEVSKSDVPQEGVEETEDVDETKDSVDEIKDSVDETKDSVDETKDSVDDDEVAPSGSDEHTAAGSPADEELDPIAEKTASLSIHDETERLIQELEDEIVVPDTSKQETSEEVEKSLEVKDATSDLQVEEEAPEDDTEVKKVEETTESELAPTEKSVEIEQSEPAAESFKESESPVEENKETEAVPVEEEEEELHEPTREEIIEMLKDEPVYIYTSLAGGGYHMPQRTNRLVTILSSNRIPFTYRDLGTDDEARSVWRRYSNGRMLPAIVRGKDDIVGNFEEIEEANEDYRVRELIYETL